MDKSLELYLPLMALTEITYFGNNYSKFQEAVLRTMDIRSQYAWEDEILAHHVKGTILEVTEKIEARYVSAGAKDRDGHLVNAWYDTCADTYITEKDKLYSAFFVYKIRHIDLMDIDDFLDYHLLNHFSNDFEKFCRFLTLALRKYGNDLLERNHFLTASEWAQQKDAEMNSATDEDKAIKVKGRPQRTSEDKLTALNQEQTVLLIRLLQESKGILQGDFLSNKLSGQAFHILTGFSADTIRQKLSTTELEPIRNRKNLTEVDNFLAKLRIQIGKELKDKK